MATFGRISFCIYITSFARGESLYFAGARAHVYIHTHIHPARLFPSASSRAAAATLYFTCTCYAVIMRARRALFFRPHSYPSQARAGRLSARESLRREDDVNKTVIAVAFVRENGGDMCESAIYLGWVLGGFSGRWCYVSIVFLCARISLKRSRNR